ncbi:hypothetical protein CF327_g987 [Tilletia walkeri]|nr:hypothetical protein CF327_g987 [Tilletia walkeri]
MASRRRPLTSSLASRFNFVGHTISQALLHLIASWSRPFDINRRKSNPEPASLGHLESWNRSSRISQSYLTLSSGTYNIVSSTRTVPCFKASKDGPIEPCPILPPSQGIQSAVQATVSSVNTVISSALAGVNDVLHIVSNRYQSRKSVASDNFRLPTFFEDGLIALNNSIPTLDRVKDKINAVISSPLKLLRTDVNNTINAFQFDRSVTALQVSNSTTIAAATTPLDELAHAVHELETFLLLALLFAMLLVGLCTVGLEWCAWRSMWRHVRLIRDVCGREKGESIDVPESEKQKAAEAEKMEASDDQVDLDNGHDDTVAHRRALESYRSLTFRISAALDGRRIAACPTDDLKGLMGAAAESPFRKTLLSEAIGASSGRKLVSYQEKTRARLTDSRALYMSA